MKTKVSLFLVLLIAICACAFANPRQQDDGIELMEIKLNRALDELSKKDSIGIYGDMITLEKMAVDEDEENKEVGTVDPLVARVERFLKCRKVQINFPRDGSSADLFGRALGQRSVDFELRGLSEGSSEARGKLKRIILPILLALKLKALIVLPIIITLIGLVSMKGLGAGLMSLLLSGAIALKALLTPPPISTRVTYGVVRPHEIHHDHWHRSQEEVNQPYRGWTPEYNGEQYPYQELP